MLRQLLTPQTAVPSPRQQSHANDSRSFRWSLRERAKGGIQPLTRVEQPEDRRPASGHQRGPGAKPAEFPLDRLKDWMPPEGGSLEVVGAERFPVHSRTRLHERPDKGPESFSIGVP